jgi:hypothetical protein
MTDIDKSAFTQAEIDTAVDAAVKWAEEAEAEKSRLLQGFC